jgi:hypothetical protein
MLVFHMTLQSLGYVGHQFGTFPGLAPFSGRNRGGIVTEFTGRRPEWTSGTMKTPSTASSF